MSSNCESLIDDIRHEYSDYKGGRLLLTKDDSTGIATLCMNSIERRNALSGTMMSQMADILTELEEWEKGKALIVFGAQGFFCSGADLNTVRHIDNGEGGRRMAILMHNNLKRLQSLPLLTVALIEGKALGGGAELITACDFRLMTSDASIGFVHIRLGVSAGWGGGSRLVQILGSTKALEVMMSGRLITADEALDIGLVQHVISDFDPENESSVFNKCLVWLSQFTKHNTQAIRAIKGIVNANRWLPLEQALNNEVDFVATVWGGPAHQKALANNIKHN